MEQLQGKEPKQGKKITEMNVFELIRLYQDEIQNVMKSQQRILIINQEIDAREAEFTSEPVKEPPKKP